MMSKTKKRMLTAIFIGFCSLICVFFVSSCSISSPKNSNKDSGHTTQSEYEDEYADFIGREIQRVVTEVILFRKNIIHTILTE